MFALPLVPGVLEALRGADEPASLPAAVKLPATEIKRQRGSSRNVRRWWRTRQAARRTMEAAGRRVHVLQCDLGDQCPERAHVLSN